MIGAITMNVAIDKAYVLQCANTPGAVMRVEKCRMTPGGKGLNVARVAHAMGEGVIAGGIIGGHAGKWVEQALTQNQIECDFECVGGETRSCINIIEPDGRQTEFLEPGLWVSPEELERFVGRFEGLIAHCQVITLSGSVPVGVSAQFYPRLIRRCKAMGKPVLLDTSGPLLTEGVQARPTLIKPNADEIRQLLNQPQMDLKDFHAIAQSARALHATGIPFVAVSLGGDGCILACDEGIFRAHPPKIMPVSTTGCGDSMIAGFAIGLARGWDAKKMLAYATAVSAANALELGTGCVDPEKAMDLLKCVRVESMNI